MKDLLDHIETSGFNVETSAAVRDFNQDDLCLLKAMFLELEKAIDEVEVKPEGTTYPGQFIYEILAKADITASKVSVVQSVVDKLVQYLAIGSNSPVQRMGAGLQKFSELLTVVFNNRGDKDNPTQSYYKVILTFCSCNFQLISCIFCQF
jgi:regulator of telomere elongation helicase 1